eukprot:3934217-Rhodomonas_salina.2
MVLKELPAGLKRGGHLTMHQHQCAQSHSFAPSNPLAPRCARPTDRPVPGPRLASTLAMKCCYLLLWKSLLELLAVRTR